MTIETIDPLSDANFDTEVLRATRPTIVQFWAPWSSTCRRVAAEFEEVAREFADTVRAASLNVDDNAQVPSNYGVTTLPTFVRFQDGRAVARICGSASRRKLRDLFERS